MMEIRFFVWIDLDMPHDPYKSPQKYYNYVCNRIDCNERRRLAMGDDYDGDALEGSHDDEDKSLGLFAMTYFMDDLAGDVLATLQATGLDQNTYFMFLADHSGDDADYINYPYAGGKGTNYEGGRHLAGMMHSPLIDSSLQGTWYNGFFTLEDIFPTFAGMAGVDSDFLDSLNLDGMDLSDYIFSGDEANSPRTEFLLNIDPYASSCDDDEYVLDFNVRRRMDYDADSDDGMLASGSRDSGGSRGGSGGGGKGGGIGPAYAYRYGDLKLMAQCLYDYSSYTYYLYNITNDPTESNNLAGTSYEDSDA